MGCGSSKATAVVTPQVIKREKDDLNKDIYKDGETGILQAKDGEIDSSKVKDSASDSDKDGKTGSPEANNGKMGSSKVTDYEAETGLSQPKRPKLEPEAVFKSVNIFDVFSGVMRAPVQPPPPNFSPGEYKNTNKPAGKVMYVPEEPGEALLKIEDTFWEEKRRVLPDLKAMKAIEEYALKVIFSNHYSSNIKSRFNITRFSINNLNFTHRHPIQLKLPQKYLLPTL